MSDLDGVNGGYHDLSHHGFKEEKIRQLSVVEQGMIDTWGDFLRELKQDRLIDETMVLMTSNLGNASAHHNDNLPVLFAGGGFRQGQHLAFSQTNNYPLPNLCLTALRRLELDIDRFATTSTAMRGLKVGG